MVRLCSTGKFWTSRRNFLLCTTFVLLLQKTTTCWCFMLQNTESKQQQATQQELLLLSSNKSKFSSQSEYRMGNTQVSTSLGRRKRPTFPNAKGDNNQWNSPWEATPAVLFGSVIVIGLAGTSQTPTTDPVLGAIETVTNVIDAAVPTSSTDLVAVALGEAIAGVIGAILSAVLKSVSYSDRKPLVTEALSDSDYFIAQAGLLPTLQAVGFSPIFATVGSVVIASVPSQLVKLRSKQQQQLIEEEKSLLNLLKREQKRQQSRNRILEKAAAMRKPRATVKQSVDLTLLKPITDQSVDFIEVFSDVTRWLAYGGLSDYGDLIIWGEEPVPPGVSGAIFGFIAAFSSRLYADLLYGVFRYGPEAKQQEVRTRRTEEWLTFYLTNSVSAATLFGVYEQSQGPVSRLIQGALAGGVDGCIGSDSFEACFDTFINANAPGPSPEAQARALITNLLMVAHRLQDIAGDTSFEDVQRLVRGWTVAASSYVNSLL